MLLRRITLALPRGLAAAVGRPLGPSARHASSTSGGGAGSSSSSSSSPGRSTGGADRDAKNLPPAFDMLCPNNADLSKGYLGRISFVDNYVIFSYMKQVSSTAEPTEGPPRHYDTKNRLNIPLTPLYFARVLAVLEGLADRCDIATRTSTGAFVPGADPHSFVFECTTTINGAPTEWRIDFDAAHSLMLHRFLREAMSCSHGFNAYSAINPYAK